jgi:trimeric autotransporter adhesin
MSQYKILRYDPSNPDTPAIVQNDDVTIGIISNQLAVNDQGINTQQLTDLAVTTGKLADTSVTTAKLALASVDATILANDAVFTAAIQDAAVTTAKLALASVDSTILASNSVTDAAVADGSVNATKILSDYVPTNSTPVQVGAEGTDRVSSALKGIDIALGALTSGTTWLPLAKAWTADASLNAVGVGGTGTVTVPFSDDTGALLPFANWLVGDFILSYNGAGTDIVFQVTALPGPTTITVTSVSVHQPVEGNQWPVAFDFQDNSQAIAVGQSIYGFSSITGHFIKIADMNFELATAIALTAGFAPVDSLFPAALDSVQTAIAKLSGNDNITTAKLQDQAVTTAKMALASVDDTIIASSAIGNGLTGGSGTIISVLPLDASIAVAAGGISVLPDPAGALVTNVGGLAVQVDGTSIDINADALEVKAAGITIAKLAVITDGVTLDQGGAGGSLEIAPLGVGTAQLADNSVTVAKIGDLVDGVTLDQAGPGGSLEIMAGGVNTAQLTDGAVNYAKLGADVHLSLGQMSVTAGYAASAGDIVYINNPDSKAYLATADVAANCPGMLYYVSVGGAINTAITIIEDGAHDIITYEVGQSFQPADALYLSSVTAGALTHVAPSSTGNQVIIMGYAATTPENWEMDMRKIASL